jgi:kinesin family protein C2/C3
LSPSSCINRHVRDNLKHIFRLISITGGQAKTLMFVQLNPDASSYSESLSTLKFAERASGVELGAARSSKEGKDARELMEQVLIHLFICLNPLEAFN